MKKRRYMCQICGNGTNGQTLCVNCSLKSNKKMYQNNELGAFDTIQEINDSRINTRLKEGFNLLNNEDEE